MDERDSLIAALHEADEELFRAHQLPLARLEVADRAWPQCEGLFTRAYFPPVGRRAGSTPAEDASEYYWKGRPVVRVPTCSRADAFAELVDVRGNRSFAVVPA